MKEKTKFTFLLEKEDLAKFKKVAESKGLNASALLRMMIKELVNEI